MKKLTMAALAAGTVIAGAGLYTVAATAHDAERGDYGPRYQQRYHGQMGMRGDDGRRMGRHDGEHRRWGRDDDDDRRGMGRGRDDDDRGRRMGRRGDDDDRGMRRGRGREEFGARMFDRLDADKDGTLTLEEAKKAPARGEGRLSRLDADNDGSVTPAEIDAWLASMRQGLLDRLDANKDGTIDAADRDASVEQRFARLDSDKDGKVTRDEARKVMAEWKRERRDGLREMRRRFWGGDTQ